MSRRPEAVREGPKLLVTGAGGRLGRFLRAAWGGRTDLPFTPLYAQRSGAALQGPPLAWPMGAAAYDGPSLKGGVLLHLAGGRGDLADNTRLALIAAEVAAAEGAAALLIASSSAVYAPAEGPMDESALPGPLAPYGAAKAAMEAAVTAWASGRAAAGLAGPKITFLRIGNVFGADQLIGGAPLDAPRLLTPVAGAEGGPLRSYIGPESFAEVIAALVARALAKGDLPEILNLALSPPVRMADLLTAAGLTWAYGAEPAPLPALELSLARLAALVPLPVADPAGMAAEWRRLLAKGARGAGA